MEKRSKGNRKKLGILTAAIALLIAIIEGALSLWRTRVVLMTFGDETNAIMQVAVQITAYLVLLESGMTVAYQLKLYKPLSEKDKPRISSLMKGLKTNLWNIVIKMFITVNICSLIYVFFLLNTEACSKYEAFMIFFIMGLRFVSPYLLTLSEKTVLFACEKGYVANVFQGILQSGTLLIEILLCKYTSLPLVAILSSYIFAVIIVKFMYVWYRKKILNIEFEHDVVADLAPKEMTKDILLHQISGMVATNTDNILLSIMSSLTNVTIYSSYNTVLNYPVTLFTTITNSMKASVIIKIQNHDSNAFQTYENVLRLSSLVMAIVTSVFMVQINRFITLWVGEKYLLNSICIAFFSYILYNRVVLNVLTIGIDAKGYYKETKQYAIAQAIVNLGLTLLLIPLFGIEGALIGTVVSIALVKEPMMSRFVYKNVFGKKNNGSKIVYSGLISAVVAAIVSYLLTRKVEAESISGFLFTSVIVAVIASCIVCVCFFVFERDVFKLFKKSIRIERKK